MRHRPTLFRFLMRTNAGAMAAGLLQHVYIHRETSLPRGSGL